MAHPIVPLPDGLVLRTATEADLAQVGELLAARGDPADAVDLELVAHDPAEGLGSIAVVVDGDRVASTATLLRESIRIDGVTVPTGQVELVATDPGYERRGLVRALMTWAHETSAARGDLLQVMIGIPFFYRQVGYSYCMPIPAVLDLAAAPDRDPTVTVRAAGVSDIAAMQALQHVAQESADVRMPHSPACWRWLVARDGSQQLVAERAGTVVGTCRMTDPHEGVIVGELAGDAGAARSLVAHGHVVGEGQVGVMERPGTEADQVLRPLLILPDRPDALREWYYARVERLAPLLDHLRPVLERRFEMAGICERHEILLSSWRSHVRFSIDPDGMGEVHEGGPEQAPVSKGGSGVPPDVVPSLLLGPLGALALEERHPDVMLGRQRELMAALFPPVTSDLLTFYLPV